MKLAMIGAVLLQLLLASLTQGLPRSLAELTAFVLLVALILSSAKPKPNAHH